MKKRDIFEEWLCCREEEDTITDGFRWYTITGSAIPVIGVLRRVVEQLFDQEALDQG
jgi:hypothetical protein